MADRWGLICTQGHMTVSQLLTECRKDRIVPLVVMRVYDDPPIVPMFNDVDVAKRFSQRNFPKQWVTGGVALSVEIIQQIDERGWTSLTYAIPRKLTDLVTFDVEIIECTVTPEAMTDKQWNRMMTSTRHSPVSDAVSAAKSGRARLASPRTGRLSLADF